MRPSDDDRDVTVRGSVTTIAMSLRTCRNCQYAIMLMNERAAGTASFKGRGRNHHKQRHMANGSRDSRW